MLARLLVHKPSYTISRILTGSSLCSCSLCSLGRLSGEPSILQRASAASTGMRLPPSASRRMLPPRPCSKHEAIKWIALPPSKFSSSRHRSCRLLRSSRNHCSKAFTPTKVILLPDKARVLIQGGNSLALIADRMSIRPSSPIEVSSRYKFSRPTNAFACKA